MKIKYRTNLCAGVGSLIFGILLWFFIPKQIDVDYSASYGITSRSMPYMLAVIFVICGVILVFQSLVRKKDTTRVLDVKKELKGIAYMLVLLIFSLLFQYSFIFSLAFLGIMTLAFMGSKKKLYYGIILALVVILYVVFTQVLHVRLP